MRRPPIRLLDVAGTPEAIGRAHGEAYAGEIAAQAEDRIALVASGLWSGTPMPRADVLDLAAACLRAHERHSPALYAELCGIAEGAGITPAEAIVAGGFTDFVDTVRNHTLPSTADEDDCTAVLVPDGRADGAGLYAQTWDMHASATDHVVLLRLRPAGAPAALVFTITGCLGQLGMNEAGVCVGITNLSAADGRVGVTWPIVVRSALEQPTAAAALDVILAADLAGGHSYLAFDATGEGYYVEAMPTARPVARLGGSALVHTNHTLMPSAEAVQATRPVALQDSSIRRLTTAAELVDRDGITPDDLMGLTRDRTICQVAAAPHHIESSGGAVMRPKSRDFWAVWGLPAHNDYQHIPFPA